MTLIPLAVCCRLLAIDGKTLRRWLAHAGLPVQAYPLDGRCKGLSDEHLLLLARAHHRRLADLPADLPASTALAPPSASPELSAELLTTLQTLSALPAQLVALQQQVAVLTHLLQQHAQTPAIAAAPAKPPRTTKRPAKPTSPALRARPTASATATTPPKPTHVLPRVEYGREGRYVVICPKQGLLPFEPDTPEWFAWVAEQSSFRFVGKGGRLTAHHEWRAPKGAWRAHRQIRNHSYTLRLAPTHELTMAVLEQAATTLQAHLQ